MKKVIWCFIILIGTTGFNTMLAQNGDFSTNSRANLDGLSDIPEWLMVQVGDALPNQGLNIWVPTGSFESSSLTRVPRFPTSSFEIISLEDGHHLNLSMIKNEQSSAQLAIAATDTLTNLTVEVGDLESAEGEIIEAQNTEVKFVKYIPVHHTHTGIDFTDVNVEGVSGFGGPNIVGDPLVEFDQIDVPKLRAQPVWITLKVPMKNSPGVYSGTIEIKTDQFKPFKLVLNLKVLDHSIPDPENFSFHMDSFMNPSAIAGYYDLRPWSEEHWNLIESYLQDLASIGQKKVTTTIVEDPWRKPWLYNKLRSQTGTGYEGMVKWKLMSDGNWSFDFSIFDRYVSTALKVGVGPYISAYSMLAFRGEQTITYYDEQEDDIVEESFNVNDERYEEVWSIFLRDFSNHLEKKGWLEYTYLGFDERPPKLMDRVLDIIQREAPEFQNRIYISGSPEVDKYASDLKIEYPYFPGGKRETEETMAVVNKRIEQGQPVRFYLTCCGDAHPNTFSYSPAIESYEMAWISLKYGLDGYSHWAYNDWPTKDVFSFPVFNYTQGDEYYVYPGKEGPISSIRWELIKEGIEDFELIQLLTKAGHLSEEDLTKAIELATRTRNGGKKDKRDIIKAREIILK